MEAPLISSTGLEYVGMTVEELTECCDESFVAHGQKAAMAPSFARAVQFTRRSLAMGTSSIVVPGPTTIEESIAVGFHASGIFLFNKDGGWTKVNNETWWRTSALLQCGEDAVLCLHARGIYRAELPSADHMIVGSSSWVTGAVTARTPADPSTIIAFHRTGVWKIDSGTGATTKLNAEHWTLVTGIVYVPEDAGIEGAGQAVLFHHMGIYRVDLSTGTSTKLSSVSWSCVKGAVYDPAHNAAVVFHDWGMYRVSCADGSHERISSSKWSRASGVVHAHDNFAMVLHDFGIYMVDMDNGSYDKVSSGGWSQLSCISPLGPLAYCAMPNMVSDD